MTQMLETTFFYNLPTLEGETISENSEHPYCRKRTEFQEDGRTKSRSACARACGTYSPG